MKIVYYYEALAAVGGIAKIFTEKMNYLADTYHHEVYVITTSQGNHPVFFNLSPNIKHFDLSINQHRKYKYKLPFRIWKGYCQSKEFNKKFTRLMADIDPDIIITTTGTWKADYIAKLPIKAKKVIESHGVKSFSEKTISGNKITAYIKRMVLRRKYKAFKYADMLVSLTQGDANEWSDIKKAVVIPNLISHISSVTADCTNNCAMAAGRLEAEKGYEDLIKAWFIVNKHYPEWRLNIYGEGSLHNNLMQLIANLNLQNIINIHPFTANIGDCYQNSSLYILSSRHEGFPLVLIEAMSYGVPCIAYNCPYGPSDIITDKEDGLIVKNGDTKELAESICFLIKNENLRKQYGTQANKNIQRYSPDVVMPQWNELFKQLVNS